MAVPTGRKRKASVPTINQLVRKGRKSKAKTRSRRANHDKMTAPNTNWCDHCGAPKLPHRVCLSCGWYKGRQILRVVE